MINVDMLSEDLKHVRVSQSVETREEAEMVRRAWPAYPTRFSFYVDCSTEYRYDFRETAPPESYPALKP